MIPQSFIQDLLNRVDIVEVVGRYVQLKKAGANFSGLCPFHNEKSPSFTVSPTKQFYHCFGCGAHGSAIGFLMEYQGYTYVEAIKMLAQEMGMVVPEIDQLPPEQRQALQVQSLALTELMQGACDYYRHQLRASQRAIEYFKKRGLTGEVAARYGLGYAPDDWQNLQAIVSNYNDGSLLETGLVIENENGRRYDRFRDRVMFPIRNIRGQVIGFGGRIIDAGEPKYLNSPETSLFHKGSELYGLFEARQAIRAAGYAIVVEGYMDVVALAQLGFPHAVATLGTAVGSTHVQKLLRYTDMVVYSFDGDTAGRKAAWRALEASLPHAVDNKTLRFLFLPAEHDPDSYVRAYGQEAFAREIDGAMPLSRWLIQGILEQQALDPALQEAEARARFVHAAKPLLQMLPAGALRMQIVREIARLTEHQITEIERLCELSGTTPANQKNAEKRSGRFGSGLSGERSFSRERRERPAFVGKRIPPDAAQRLLLLLIAHPQYLNALHEQDLASEFSADTVWQPVLHVLLNWLEQGDAPTTFVALFERAQSLPEQHPLRALVQQIAADSALTEVVVEAELQGTLLNYQLNRARAESDLLIQVGLPTETDRERYRALQKKIEILRKTKEQSFSGAQENK